MRPLFENICTALGLGRLTAEPRQLSGGYMHRMFAVTTGQGQYAVKLLNPEVMARPEAAGNYRRAEAFEAMLEQQGLPILPALSIGGHKMHCVNGQYLYIFPYYDGRALRDGEITPAHCRRMGEALARIHATARREAPECDTSAPIDWPALTAALLHNEESRAWGARMHCALPMLIRQTRRMALASAQLPRSEALCHNDMDAKNVLWQGEDFRIIDLECLGWGDPQQEMLDLAISWAGWPQDEERFLAFVAGYRQAGGQITADADVLYDSRRNHLDWLAYNARRALHDDPGERRIGREQIDETLEKLDSDRENRRQVLRWLEEVCRS